MTLPGEAVLIPGPRFWTLRNLAGEMRRHPPDLLFVPAYVIPPVHPRSVVTIHDLGYIVEPNSHDPWHRRQLEWSTRWNCRAASGIIAVSESTRQNLIDLLDLDPARVHTVHLGVSDRYQSASVEAIADLRSRYGLPDPFVLAVGTLHPRKNLIRLIEAFELLAGEEPDLRLVFAGRTGWRGDEILARACQSPVGDRIIHLGYVPLGDLPALYSAARVTAFPSLYEGFGLPALESMRCRTPVVASDRSSLPEVCGGAAVLVDPFDPASIASGMASLLPDSDRRTTLIQRGTVHAESLTWEDCASRTLDVLRETYANDV